MADKKNELDKSDSSSNERSSDYESSDEQLEQTSIQNFKFLSKILKSFIYNYCYFTLSVALLSYTSAKWFPKHNLKFVWNIFRLIK